MAGLSTTIRHIIKPSWLFRKVLLISADRKVYTLVLIHLAMSAVIFTHFAMSKFHSQKEKVPEGAPYYSWKVGIPTFEFGTMHTILFQLALLPLTMCRLLISNLWNSPIGKYLPFDEMTKCHIALGYTLVFLLFATIVVFLMFFGVLCNSGAQDFCDKFKTEIIITGYVIFVAFMTVGVTSFLRFKIPYKVFYAIHHVVFIAYVLTIMHTIDVVERRQGGRSQSFKWFSASLLVYLCDRAAMYLTNRHDSVVVESNAIDSDISDKMVILKVKKPNLFHFYPGQYVYLKIPAVDNRWHPFSIGSAPESDTLDFYIKVYKETSWSGKIFRLLQDSELDMDKGSGVWQQDNPFEKIKVEILGGYGVGISDGLKYSRALIVGAGTGFVPCLSLLHEHVNKCVTIDPKKYDNEIDRGSQNLNRLFRDQSRSFVATMKHQESMDQSSHLVQTLTQIQNAKIAKRQLVVNSLSMLGPMVGVLMLGFTLSWHQLPFALYPGMETFLICGTIFYQVSFLALALHQYSQGISHRNIWIYTDMVISALNALADWYFFSRDVWGGNFDPEQLVCFSLLSFYMIFRFIDHVIRPDINPVEEMNKRKTGLVVFDKVKFVWVSRSASSIAQVYPDIANHWERLVKAWGLKRARENCEISVYCTDPSMASCQDLVDGLQLTSLYREGAIKFGRPSFEEILDKCTEEVLDRSETNVSTSTLFAFCGSDTLAKHVKEVKMFNDMILSMTGNTQHMFTLVTQSYGGLVSSRGRNAEVKTDSDEGGTSIVDIIPTRENAIQPDEVMERRKSGLSFVGSVRLQELRELAEDGSLCCA